MLNNINTLALQNSETSSSSSSSPCPFVPSLSNSIMNDYIKSVTERMIHLSVLEVGRIGNDGILVVQLHNTFDFGVSVKQRTCIFCAVLCASGCGCGRLQAEESIFNGVSNGNVGPSKFGRGARGFRRGKFGRRNGRNGQLETIREWANGRGMTNEQNGERERWGTAGRRGGRRHGRRGDCANRGGWNRGTSRFGQRPGDGADRGWNRGTSRVDRRCRDGADRGWNRKAARIGQGRPLQVWNAY